MLVKEIFFNPSLIMYEHFEDNYVLLVIFWSM